MRENVKILVVARDPLIRDFIIDTLEFSVNRKVLGAENAGQALDQLRTGGPVDIVFCDEVLDRMSGRELLATFKKHQPRCSGVLIAPPPMDPGAVADAVVDAYLESPADIQALFDIVQKFVVDG